MTKTIDPQHAADLYELLDYEHGKTNPSPPMDDTCVAHEWVLIGSTHIRTARWEERYWLVLRDADDVTWGIQYGIGLTECQDDYLPWKERTDPLQLTQLYPHEVTTVEYRTATP